MAAAICYSAAFFDGLDAVKQTFSYKVFGTIAPQAEEIFGQGLLLFIMWTTAMMVWQPGSFQQRFVGLSKLLLASTVVFTLIKPDSVTSEPLVYSMFITPIESMSIEYGKEIISLSGVGVGAGTAKSQYGTLSCMVESQVWKITNAAKAIIVWVKGSSSILSVDAFMGFIAATMMALPYVFVLAIFAAFMVEAMFKIVAAGIIAPVLVPFAIFPPLRPFTIAGLRIIFGAALTIIFASGAMGFSMSVVDKYASNFQEQADVLTTGASTRDANEAARADCNKLDDEYGLKRNRPDMKEYCKALDDQWNQSTSNEVKLHEQGIFSIFFTEDYWMLFLIGFASVLLHLSAKSLASNISGANDGAGPAAATVAAAKLTLGAGAFAASRVAFGSGGIGTTASAFMRGETGISGGGLAAVGQAMHGHGAVGSVAALASHFIGGGSPPAPMASPAQMPGGERYSLGSGGGAAPSMAPDMSRAFQDMTKSLQSIEKALTGGGRNRDGVYSG